MLLEEVVSIVNTPIGLREGQFRLAATLHHVVSDGMLGRPAEHLRLTSQRTLNEANLEAIDIAARLQS